MTATDPLPQLLDLVRRLPASPGRALLVAVDGRSGAGKSTLGARLADALGATLVPMECMYTGWDGLEGGIDVAAEHVVAPLAAGARTLQVPGWDWAADRTGPPLAFAAGDVVVLEGVGAGAARLRDRLDALIWLEAPEAVRRERALERDGDAYRPFWERWAAQERRLYARDAVREHADVVVDTSELAPPGDAG